MTSSLPTVTRMHKLGEMTMYYSILSTSMKMFHAMAIENDFWNFVNNIFL